VGAEQEAAEEAGAPRDGRAEVRPGGADDRRVHDRAARRQDRAAAGLLRNSRRAGFYNGTDTGWGSFFRTLRHYLEHNPGKPRTTIKIVGKASGTLEETWPRMLAAVAQRGIVVFEKAPGVLEVAVPSLGDAYLWHTGSRAGEGQFVYTMLSLYGKSPAEVEAIRAEWQPWLEQLLGVESPGHDGH
jgi:hypothetical protein